MSTLVSPTRDTLDTLLYDYLQRIKRLEGNVNRGHYQIKVFADANTGDGNLPDSVRIVTVGNGKFILAIPDDLNNARLWDCFCYVTTAGSSIIRVQLRYVEPGDNPNTTGTDLLTTRMEIEAGDYTSYDATNQPVIDNVTLLEKGGMIAIDVDNAGGGVAEGLGVGIELNPPPAA